MKAARHYVFIMLMWFFAPFQADAATYNVAVNGNDADSGTIEKPFATLHKAVGLANPGDTIYLRGGTYRFTAQVWINRSGSPGKHIKVFNHPGEHPIIDGRSLPSASPYAADITLRENTGWWHFKGLEVSYAPSHGFLLVGSSNNIIEQCVTHHNTRLQLSGGGIMVGGGSSNNLILNNDSHHNGVHGSNGGDGIGVTGLPNTGNIVRGNRVWRNNDDGIDLWDAHGVVVENNWSWENGKKDDLSPSGRNGVGFKLGGSGGGDGGHTIRNNMAWRNVSNGFDANSADQPMNVFNNTSWENGGSNFHFDYETVSYVLKNNVAFLPNTVSMGSSAQHTHNSWDLDVTVNPADFLSLDYSGADGMRSADGSLPAIDFLRLAVGSDLVDKGVDVGIPFNGGAPDLGALENDTKTSSIDAMPLSFEKLNVFPNPFNTSTVIDFYTPKTGNVDLSIYSIAGQRICELASGPSIAGEHHVKWDGNGISGKKTASGIYFVRLNDGFHSQSRKILLIK